MSKLIPLTQGKFAIVDDGLFDYLNQWKWQAQKDKKTYYAVRTAGSKPYRRAVLMHRVIMNAPIGQQIDHKNRHGLDNRLSNMRLCTSAENQHNQRLREGYTSKFKGVSWKKENNKWVVQIMLNYKKYYIGLFVSEREAAMAYNQKAIEMFGEFAKLNEVA